MIYIVYISIPHKMRQKRPIYRYYSLSCVSDIWKNGTPERTKFFVRKSRIKEGYCDKIRYIFRLVV